MEMEFAILALSIRCDAGAGPCRTWLPGPPPAD